MFTRDGVARAARYDVTRSRHYATPADMAATDMLTLLLPRLPYELRVAAEGSRRYACHYVIDVARCAAPRYEILLPRHAALMLLLRRQVNSRHCHTPLMFATFTSFYDADYATLRCRCAARYRSNKTSYHSATPRCDASVAARCHASVEQRCYALCCL